MPKALDIFDYLFEHYPLDANGLAHFKKLVKRKAFSCSVSEMLYYAEYGGIDYIAFLLDQGADINIQSDDHGVTPLMKLAQSADEENTLALSRYLLEQGADPNLRNFGSHTALHRALTFGNYHQMKLLLEHGADPNLQTDLGATALKFAIVLEPYPLRLQYVITLLQHGANPQLKEGKGYTAMDYAKERKYHSILRLLGEG
jgi:ankyrin repeat protein